MKEEGALVLKWFHIWIVIASILLSAGVQIGFFEAQISSLKESDQRLENLLLNYNVSPKVTK